jgi:hypothetical protein
MSTFSIPQGVQVSLDGSTWYKLSDHNRNPISITYTLIEQTDRMANGTLRKYVVARKFVISVDWKDFPTLDTNLVDYDGNTFAAAWIKAFYEKNYNSPVYVKLMFAQDTGIVDSNNIPVPGIPNSSLYQESKNTSGQIFTAFMTTFTYDVAKRMRGYDYVNLKIEFTEI